MKVNEFRGVDIDDDMWKYGHFVKHSDSSRCFIFSGELVTDGIYPTWDRVEVIPKTVGQSTGLYDKNGKEIYEGDRIDTPSDKSLTVERNERYASFYLNRCGWMHPHWFGEAVEPNNCEVVGNIYENPKMADIINHTEPKEDLEWGETIR